jgi:LacI family transcriptional regulator
LAEHGRGSTPPTWLKSWRGDGIIARIENSKIAAAVAATRLPIVDVSAARLLPKAPMVETDDHAIARLAAEHLLERGFRRFAFVGDPRFKWSIARQEIFARLIDESGNTCDVLPALRQRTASKREDDQNLERWLRKLPKPVGLMAAYDILGQQVLEACRRVELAVPDEIAVVGVDNDELLCELSEPPLTSVIPNPRRTGYEAARLLDRMMAGEKVRPDALHIEPVGIAVRQSSDVLAIEDRQISTAVRFIREHGCDGINVEDVLRLVPLSRRVLESRFRRLVGRTPHDEIIRVRLDRAKELLTVSDLPLTTIADRSGFRHVEYMSVVFKREIGTSPSLYRRRQRVHGEPRK